MGNNFCACLSDRSSAEGTAVMSAAETTSSQSLDCREQRGGKPVDNPVSKKQQVLLPAAAQLPPRYPVPSQAAHQRTLPQNPIPAASACSSADQSGNAPQADAASWLAYSRTNAERQVDVAADVQSLSSQALTALDRDGKRLGTSSSCGDISVKLSPRSNTAASSASLSELFMDAETWNAMSLEDRLEASREMRRQLKGPVSSPLGTDVATYGRNSSASSQKHPSSGRARSKPPPNKTVTRNLNAVKFSL